MGVPTDPMLRVAFWMGKIEGSVPIIEVKERVITRCVMDDKYFEDWKVGALKVLINSVFKEYMKTLKEG